ncbi:glycoside hydrolase family 16 protein [Deinococcus koreensis]|uniref:O-glycosyl hydrolase n=1 Tax=Deinococcus koreensis TaxID=2054903 RepID=A0A2K3UV02_9DEIO|nr:glycoside hydrolase family 16 protein [Deinococcus koreensis]PNY80361.1 O-glycosyl hydrolase [Deinococcus koreensis]
MTTIPERPGYVLDFCEEFIGPDLDRSRWLPHYLPHWSSRARTATRYTLPGRGLQLHITEDMVPWNPAFDGELRVSNLQTGCFAGPLGSSVGQLHFKPGLRVTEEQPTTRLYTPRYGYFEVRLKAVPVPGYMAAFWMIGFQERPEESGEICVVELFGQDVTAQTLTVKSGIHPFGDPALREEFDEEVLEVDPAAFHTYAVDWTPTHVDFFVDDTFRRRVRQSPAYPMQFMLDLYELPDQLPAGRQGPWPKTLEVEWVRGYRRA